MPRIRSNLSRLLAALPAILLMTFVNTFITSTVAGVVLLELAAAGHKYVAFGAALLTAVAVYSWLVFSHKLRAYIKVQETPDE